MVKLAVNLLRLREKMYLKHLKINGFKSFGREVTFTFDKNLNIIVGPNGSGKSNIIDAVKWLLGEAKYKSIRLDHPESVLFNGNDSLSPAKIAKVEMIIDNSDEEISDFGKEISIMRTYKKADSKYYIDNKRVNLKDIKNFISDKGLGKEFYSIISQGKITELVKSGGKNMKKLLDQAAGITPFYQKKDEALRNLEQTQQNLLRISDIVKEINSQKNSLNLQAKRAEKFLQYKTHLNNLKATKLTRQMNDFQTKLNLSNKEISELKTTLAEKQKELDDKNEKLQEYRQKYSKIDQLMKELTSSIDSLRNKEESFNSKLDKINLQINDKNLKRDNLQFQIDSNKKRIEDIENDLQKNEKLLKALEAELEKKGKDYLSVENERKALTQSVDEIQKKNYEIQEEIFKLKSQLNDIQSDFESRDQKLKSIDNDIENVKNEIENNKYKIQQSKEKMKAYLDKMKDYDELDKKLKDEIMKKEVLLNNLKHNFEDVNSLLNKLNLKLSSLKEQYNMNLKWLNSYEGYSRAVKILFKEVKKNPNMGIIDTVANIIRPVKGYEMAINALISSRLQNVIAKTSSDVKEAISILKQYKAGRITFLPMDLIEGKLYSTQKPLNTIEFARNLVEYDKKYEKIINFIFTNAVVVENMDMAINLKKSGYKGRISTLTGDVVLPGGAITGGSTDEHSLNLMSRQNILDSLQLEIDKIEKEMDKKTIDLSRLSIKMNETSDSIRALKSKGSEYQSDYDRLKNQIELYSEMMTSYESNIQKLDKKLQGLEKLKPSLKGEMEDFQSKLSYMKELIETKENDRQQIKKQMEDIIEKYRKIDLQTSEKKRVYDKLKNEYDSVKSKIDALENEKAEIQDTLVENEIEIKSLIKEIDTLNDDAFYIKQDIDKVKKDINDKINEMKSNSELKSKGAELLQTLRDEVKDTESTLSKIKDDLRGKELQAKEYQVKLEDLKLSLGEMEYEQILEKAENIDESIKDLEGKLKHIGTVNLNAFEEYKEVLKRFEEYEKQRNDIISAKEKIENLIAKLDQEARNKFILALEKIQEHFNKMMDILFNGGGGEIILTNPENVLETEVDIAVKVPHKKIKSLYAMSGGEQTLIGVALMFAFLKTNPSPFYILDEIDANLDSANTERISMLLKTLSQDTQFIVITHNKIMMDIAKTIYGITMEKGLTRAIHVKL